MSIVSAASAARAGVYASINRLMIPLDQRHAMRSLVDRALDAEPQATLDWAVAEWYRALDSVDRRNALVDVMAQVTRRDPVMLIFALEHGVEVPLREAMHCYVVNHAPDGWPTDPWIHYGDGVTDPVRCEDRIVELRERYHGWTEDNGVRAVD